MKKLQKAIKSLGMKPSKVNQSKSKIALKNYGAVKLELKKSPSNFKDICSDLAENLVTTLPVTLNKFNSNSTKQY